MNRVCTVTAGDLKDGKTAYIELDNVDGFTEGDKPVNEGDAVDVGVVIHVDECNEWLATAMQKPYDSNPFKTAKCM